MTTTKRTAEPARTMSVAHAAVHLDCSPDHIYRLIADGSLGYLNIGRLGRPKIRIPVAVLDRYITSRLTTAERLTAAS